MLTHFSHCYEISSIFFSLLASPALFLSLSSVRFRSHNLITFGTAFFLYPFCERQSKVECFQTVTVIHVHRAREKKLSKTICEMHSTTLLCDINQTKIMRY